MIKNIQGIEIDVIRKNVKNMNLTVLPPDGRVRISVPFGVSDRRVEAFVESKLAWILKHRKLVIDRSSASTAGGESCGGLGSNRFSPESEAERRALIARYRLTLTPLIEHYLAIWQPRTALYAESWQLRDMKTRWGSCTPKTRRIRFSVWLAEKTPELIEYVVLHELAHIAVPNHGTDFKAFMSAHMPDWRERQKQLNGKSNTLNQNRT